jgi:hypothetical protein
VAGGQRPVVAPQYADRLGPGWLGVCWLGVWTRSAAAGWRRWLWFRPVRAARAARRFRHSSALPACQARPGSIVKRPPYAGRQNGTVEVAVLPYIHHVILSMNKLFIWVVAILTGPVLGRLQSVLELAKCRFPAISKHASLPFVGRIAALLTWGNSPNGANSPGSELVSTVGWQPATSSIYTSGVAKGIR